MLWMTVCILLQCVNTQTYENATNLRAMLLKGYQKDVRPVNNQSHVVNVNISLDLYGMPEVDGVRGIITLTAATQSFWFDERMTWNPADYGGITKIPIVMTDVWTPSITLGTPIEFTSMGNLKSHVTYYANGLAFFYPGNVLDSSCTFNMRYWPFDKQVCDVGFYPMDYTLDQVSFSTPSPGVSISSFKPNAEWTLEGTDHHIDANTIFSVVYFRLRIKRQSLFYVFTVILPIFGITSLTCLIFVLPSESGERVSYAITIMLSLSVFMMVVSDEIPKSAEPLSLMCCYIFAAILVSVVGTVLAIINLEIHHRSENVPKRILYIKLLRFTRCRRDNTIHNNLEQTVETVNVKGNRVTKVSSGTFLTNTNMDKINSTAIEAGDSEHGHETWKDVSRAIDSLLFYSLIILTYIPSIIFLIYMVAASDYQA